jgi:hypothetical protein
MGHLSPKALLLTVTVIICLSSTCWGQSEKLSVALQAQNVPAELDVIIRYKQVPCRSPESGRQGGIHRNTFNSIKAGLYRVPASAVRQLTNDPNVAYISPDRPVSAYLDQAQTATSCGVPMWSGAPSWKRSGRCRRRNNRRYCTMPLACAGRLPTRGPSKREGTLGRPRHLAFG